MTCFYSNRNETTSSKRLTFFLKLRAQYRGNSLKKIQPKFIPLESFIVPIHRWRCNSLNLLICMLCSHILGSRLLGVFSNKNNNLLMWSLFLSILSCIQKWNLHNEYARLQKNYPIIDVAWDFVGVPKVY